MTKCADTVQAHSPRDQELPLPPQDPVDEGNWFIAKDMACCFYAVCTGFTDSSAGPLLPYLQLWYKLDYVPVSTLFICQCVGSVMASFLNTWLTNKIGVGKVLALGAFLQLVGYILLPPALPFAVFDVAYAIIGFGVALQFAQANAFMSYRPHSSHRLGLLHGFYGLGGVAGPLASTAFVKSTRHILLFYLTGLGLSVVNLLSFLIIFRLRRHTGVSPEVSADTQEKSGKTLRKILTHPLMWTVIPFLFLYVGSEITIGGWVVTYLLKERHGGVSTGYVSSGYWAGLALGRIFLPSFNIIVGEKQVVYPYILLIIGLELVVWLVNSLVGGAVATALVGVFMGPFFPIALSIVTKTLPHKMHVGAIGFMASLGQAGGAIFPFITGALAERFDVWVLQPLLIAMFGIMACLWFLIPDGKGTLAVDLSTSA